LHVGFRAGRLQLAEASFQGGKVRAGGHLLQVRQQGRRPAQDRVQRITVRIENQRLRMMCLMSNAAEMCSVLQVALERGKLDLNFGHRRAVRPHQAERGRTLGTERHTFANQPQFGDRRPRPAADLGRRPQPHVPALYSGRKLNHAFRGGVGGGKRPPDHRFAKILCRFVADVALVVLDGSVLVAVRARLVAKAGNLVTPAQVDDDLVRMSGFLELPVGVPQGARVAVHGPKPLVVG